MVDRRSPDECWPWTGSKNPRGYGQLTASGGSGSPRLTLRAHRLAYEFAYGAIPDGLHVLHHCDNRPCCNASHLFLGTNDDNHEDKRTKGRGAKGERMGAAKLTEAQVLDIRRRHASGGVSQRALSREYGVAPGRVCEILSGKAWSHV